MAKRLSETEYLENVRAGLAQSVEFYQTENRAVRERWVCREFVHNLNVKARERSFESPAEDPPDVVYRGCRFEVKEILDTGRRRHLEYRERLAQAMKATRVRDLLRTYSPKPISPAQVGSTVLAECHALARKYEPKLMQSLDLVFYVNLVESTLEGTDMPDLKEFEQLGWRSVSALIGWAGLVFFASQTAPRLLRGAAGSLCVRRGRI